MSRVFTLWGPFIVNAHSARLLDRGDFEKFIFEEPAITNFPTLMKFFTFLCQVEALALAVDEEMFVVNYTQVLLLDWAFYRLNITRFMDACKAFIIRFKRQPEWAQQMFWDMKKRR
jgi:hypothetical protein